MSSKGIFESLLEHTPLFVNREVLRSTFTPEELPHRDRQVGELAKILVAALRGETPSNIIIYGKPGTGKTAVVRYLGNELRATSDDLSSKWAETAVPLFVPTVAEEVARASARGDDGATGAVATDDGATDDAANDAGADGPNAPAPEAKAVGDRPAEPDTNGAGPTDGPTGGANGGPTGGPTGGPAADPAADLAAATLADTEDPDAGVPLPPGVDPAELFGEVLAEEIERPVTFVHINCESVDTQYRVLTRLVNEFIDDPKERIPFTGWPTDEVLARLMERIDEAGGATVVVLDEVDKLVKKSGDDALYNLTRVNADLQRARVSVIGISNDLNFLDYLDPRVRSSLGEDEIIFPPYNAEQLQDILRQRADMAFRDGTLDAGVIPLCAALAAQEHGDARRALDLLRVSAEICERAEERTVTEDHVRRAQDKIELDRIREVIRDLPTQSKLVLLGTVVHRGAQNGGLTTGEVYDVYKQLSQRAHGDILTQRRVTDLISELDMLGILNARVISKGRYGRTKEIKLSVPCEHAKRVLGQDEVVGDLVDYRPEGFQARLDGDA